MHAVSPRLWDLGEESGDELVDIEGLSLGVHGEGVVVRRFSFVEEGASSRRPMDTRQGEGASKQVACHPLDAFGVLRPDGGRAIDGKSAVAE